ncbi:coiled-coil domain-containing protein 148 isoform X1 [Pipra filicauda]|uniref:Coiled-coil domain-containing protein 148 isoform X1 n=1 Tax=Pipra filicauda TaxID=649802 RepID=A0A7R5K4V6_9PASS|nr:coiled-coil domain-containing protein 148 isoform X1 [Pipra filicauda]
MAELDHGTLFSAPRISDGENPVIPARKALCSQKYKPVDYKHLHELAAEAKMASEKTQLKIKKTEQVSKFNKEQMLLKQHRQVWWQEHKRLSESRQKAEGEIKTFLNEATHKHNFLDLRDLEQELSRQRDTYQTNSVVPVWQLKEDLKLKLAEMQRSLSEESCQKPEIDSFEILQQIKFVKNQQKAVLEGLVLESLALERELEDYKANALVGSFEEKNGLFHEVPAELLSLECPYPDLKTLVIQEYQELASGYWARLQEVDQQLEALSRNSDWKEEDQWVFQAVINQYPSDLQRRRTLYLDMLQRYLPHKSWHELVAHEKAWDHCHSIRNQHRALLLSWAQARKAFVLRAVATAAEAAAAHEAEVVLADSRQKQLEICAELKAKVLQWKAQQEEAAKLEAAVAARRKEKEDEKKRLQREQETSRRAQEKEKLKKYWAEKQLKWQEQEERDLQRLEELRKLMAEQAAKDRERLLLLQNQTQPEQWLIRWHQGPGWASEPTRSLSCSSLCSGCTRTVRSRSFLTPDSVSSSLSEKLDCIKHFMQERFCQKFLHQSFQEETWSLQLLKCRPPLVSGAEELQGCRPLINSLWLCHRTAQFPVCAAIQTLLSLSPSACCRFGELGVGWCSVSVHVPFNWELGHLYMRTPTHSTGQSDVQHLEQELLGFNWQQKSKIALHCSYFRLYYVT